MVSIDSYFNEMLSCGENYNHWVARALKHLPISVLAENKDKLYFVSTAHRDGSRLARMSCENREVIVLSERILPKRGASLGDDDVRYFVYVVLHETVHAIKKHKSLKFDSLSDEECQAQEDEADSLALEWFNAYVDAQNNPYMKKLTVEEIEVAQARNQQRMEDLYNGIDREFREPD